MIKDPIDDVADLLFGPLDIYAASLVKIPTKEGGLVDFEMNEPQMRLDREINRQKDETNRVRMLVPKARQLGVSTYTGVRFYRRTTTLEGQNTFILTHEDKATENLFQVAKTAHDHMLPELRPKASNDAAHALAFRRMRSRYTLATARTKGSGRSATIQNFHGSEVAYWPNAEDHLSGVMEAIGDNQTEAILESTGNGPAGPFYDLCMQALAGRGDWRLCFLPWFQMTTYRRKAPDAWKPPGPWLRYAKMHGLTKSQCYWAYQKNLTLAVQAKVDPDEGPCWAFIREYPATLDEVFVAPGIAGLINPELVLRARKSTPHEDDHAPLLLGVDVARHGDDFIWLIDRQGRTAGERINLRIPKTDNLMHIVGLVVTFIQTYRPARVFIDVTGMGWGVYDRLVELKYGTICTAVDFGTDAMNPDRYVNRRSEMWVLMSEWFASPGGVSVPDDDLLSAHLIGPQYTFDSNGRYRLERKEDMKKPARLGFSPDGGDALGLTFAEPVAAISPDDFAKIVALRSRPKPSAWAR